MPSDSLKLVRFVAPHFEGARPVVLAQLTTDVRKIAEGGSPQLAPGERELGNVILDVPYAGEVPTLDRHHNSRLSFVLRTFAADPVADADAVVAAILAAPSRSAIEWRRDGVGFPTYYPLRGDADWGAPYSMRERQQGAGQLVQFGCEAAPFVHRGAMDVFDDFSVPSDAVALATNLVTNPSFEVNTAGWSPSVGTLASEVTSRAKAGVRAGRVRGTITSDVVSLYSDYMPIAAGEPLSARTAFAVVSGVGGDCWLRVEWWSATAEVGDANSTRVSAPADGSDHSFTITNAVAPAGTTRFRFRAILVTSGTQTYDAFWDAFLAVKSATLPAYFDGDTDKAAWTGTPHASTSVLYDRSPLEDYTFDAGTGTLGAGGGQLVPTSTAEKRLWHSARGYRYEDVQATMKIVTGAAGNPSAGVGLLLRRISADNLLLAQVRPGAGAIDLYKRDGGAWTELGTTPIAALAAGTAYWVRGRVEGNLFVVEWFTAAPAPMAAPAATLAHTLAGANATKFGAGVSGDVGIRLDSMPLDWRIDDFTVEPFTYRNRTLPDRIALGGPIPGDLPALTDLEITPSGGAAAPIHALIGWAPRPRPAAAGTVAPLGVIEAESATALSIWTVVADAAARGGSKLSVDLVNTQSGPAEASFPIDPSTLEPDPGTDTVSLEVFARVQRAPTLLAPRLVLLARGGDVAAYGSDRYTEHGAGGVALPVPAATDWRTVRLGRIRLWAGAGSGTARLTTRGTWTTGSTGLFALDYLLAVPSRAFVASPSGAIDSSYPSFVRTTDEITRILNADGGGAIRYPATALPRGEAGLGRRIELPTGNVDLVAKLANLPVDHPTAGSAGEQLAHTATVRARVLPRYHLV